MPTVDLRGATSPIDIRSAELLKFGTLSDTLTATTWSYLTPTGNRVVVTGTGLQYDANGNPIAGTATGVAVDVAGNGTVDVVVAGLNEALSPLGSVLRSNPVDFWLNVLDGNDVILGPTTAGAFLGSLGLAGDGFSSRAGAGAGGRDIIDMGGVGFYARGDVDRVGSGVAGSAASTYRGGDDDIAGLVTDAAQAVIGDAGAVYMGSTLTGGDDVILIQSRHGDAYVAGDAGDASGRVIGGDDYVTGGKDFRGQMAGDVVEAHPTAIVTGGTDTLNGGDLNEILVGDVFKLRGGRLDGGDDIINGDGGNDIIAGDAWDVRSDSKGTGGDDLIHGGGGNDEIHGDFAGGGSGIAGGNDRLYGDDGDDRLFGEGGADTLDGGNGLDRLSGGDGDDWLSGGAGNDTIYGDAGNDMLDGGAGADALAGLQGDDTYFVNDAGDTVTELAGFGNDTVWTTLATATLAANVENLRYNGAGAFTATGNALVNTIEGSAGADRLDGGAGDDVLVGGAGADTLLGGAGRDTASYATASAGVEVWMEAPGASAGDADGDVWLGIEDLAGSAFGDMLAGDAAANRIAGGGGSDVLAGQGGADTLRGGAGSDVLFGDGGADVFDFDAPSESTASARDVIRGAGSAAFEGAGVAGGDVIDLGGIDANATLAGNQAFAFGGTGIGRVSVVASGENSLVRANTDNDAAFEIAILIEDGGLSAAAYRAGDFIL